MVTGGHPSVDAARAAMATRRRAADDWAPTIAALLDLDLPDTTGRSLLP